MNPDGFGKGPSLFGNQDPQQPPLQKIDTSGLFKNQPAKSTQKDNDGLFDFSDRK